MGLEQLTDTSLHEAVRFGDISEIQQAIKDGCDPNQIGIYQWSPLHEATHNGDVDIVQLLLDTGGDPNRRDMLRGSTAVHYAALQGYTDCLRLLLGAGGRCDLLDDAGKSGYDVATKECKLILEQQLDATQVISQKKDEEVSEHGGKLAKHKPEEHKHNSSDVDNILELDSVSMATSIGSNSTCSRACSTESVWSAGRDPVLGHIQLSFEYNIKQKTLKIRVWQLEDLLLPPANTSMISNIYVKSYLQPDKKKTTRRKTEEVSVDTSRSSSSKKKSSSDVMTPSTFKFTKALEYSGVTETMVAERIVDVSVCITQKYTRRSFTIATWHLALDAAVRKLRKEKFVLRPLIRAEIPENMKVYYCPSELTVNSSWQRNFSSDPNLKRSSSISGYAVAYNSRAVSDSDLKQVAVGNSMQQKIPSIEITMPQPEDDPELQDALKQILVMEMDERSSPESDIVEMHDLDVDGGGNTIQVEVHKTVETSEFRGVKVVGVTETPQVAVHIEETDQSTKDDSVRLSQVMIDDDVQSKDVIIPMQEVTERETIEMSSLGQSSDRYLSVATGKERKGGKKKAMPRTKKTSDSLPETSTMHTRRIEVQLPIATALDLPTVHSSCKNTSI